ncbi:MAG TPA: hypothetical protein VKQ72_11560 [Aggregatilineales bacterium]|nr:hypothetical protein [Aggregatilineales bacterium]
MSSIPVSEKTTPRGVFGVFPVDPYGTVGDLVGMWHRTLPEAEQYLKLIRDHQGKNYITLSSAEHDKQTNQQQAAGLAFKTGHDLLMDQFDQWLKENHMVRGAGVAVKLGLSDKEFKSVVKRGLIERRSMPDHDNLVGYPADFTLTKEQHQQFINERTLNAHQLAEELGLNQKEFSEVRRRSNMAKSDEFLGRTIPNDSGTSPLYSRADVEKLRSIGEEVKAQGVKPAGKPAPGK